MCSRNTIEFSLQKKSSNNANSIGMGDWIAAALGHRCYFYLAAINRDGSLVYMNEYLRNDALKGSRELSATSIFDLLCPEDHPIFREAIESSVSPTSQVIVEAGLKNNDQLRVNWEIKFQTDLYGQAARFLCVGYNKLYEEEIKKNMDMKDRGNRLVDGGFPGAVLLYGKKGTEPLFNHSNLTQQDRTKNGTPSLPASENGQVAAQVPSALGDLKSCFLDHTPYFSWVVDKDENLLFANQALMRYFSGSESSYGQNIFKLIPESIASVFHRKHMAVLDKRRPVLGIVRSLMADGREHIFQVTVFPIPGETGDLRIGGEALDVTEDWLTKPEIKETSRRFACISKATSEAIWDWNLQTGKITANQALHELIGAELEQVADLAWCYECIHPDDREQVEKRVKRVLEKKEESWEQEFRFLHRDGSYKLVLKRGFVIYENDEPLRMICTLQDISEIKEMEQQLVEQKLEQQKGIAEAIIQAQEIERNRIGNELHDNVNQILSTAQLYLNTLDPARDDVYDLKDRTKVILSLAIEEIRKLSRGLVAPNMREAGLVKSICDLVEEIRFANPFRIVFEHSDPQDIEVLCQQKKITLLRIFQEQIKNIINYSKANQVEISLHCYHDQVRLFISDDGVGFDAKNTPRGLGLSNIYERTRLYSGKVILHTSPGMGCSLIVNIPSGTQNFLDQGKRQR